MYTDAIWIIDNDKDDREIVQEVLQELGLNNELVFLTSSEEAIDRLSKVPAAPFIIICELNMPRMNGFGLREKLLESGSKKLKSVPFIFWSTEASEAQITQAYDLSVHGFFIKEGSFTEVKQTFSYIINYWSKSKMPSKTGKK